MDDLSNISQILSLFFQQLETKKIVSKESHYWLLQTERKHVEKSPDSGVTVNPMRTQDMLECKGENVGTQET